MRLKNWLIPLVAWIVIFMGLKLILGGGCNDGWGSSSIGRMGACSHHGGVNHTRGFIAFSFPRPLPPIFFKIDEMDTRKIKTPIAFKQVILKWSLLALLSILAIR
ncbi:hypothetical protein [Escherichia coli]|uniref:hypothetical protein n=1 Tax=Escherichia coli TaxID=562 RepID=UPI00388F5E67